MISVVFDAALMTRIALHDKKHPKAKKSEDLGDSSAVKHALVSLGHKASVLGLGEDVAPKLHALAKKKPRLVFNLCDTLAGKSELGPTVAALLSVYGLSFTGARADGLMLSKRKHDVKAVLVREGLPTPKYQTIADNEALKTFTLALEPPVILKLTAEHSSIGIDSKSVCFDEKETKARAKDLFKRFRQPVLIEEYVGGREFYVSFVGDPPRALPLMEMPFDHLPPGALPIRSFDTKWFEKSSNKMSIDPRWAAPVPYRAPPVPWCGTIDDISEVCRRAFLAIGCRDWGRVDLRLDRGGVPMIIDVTPNTYLGKDAPCIRAAAAAGLSYERFIERVIQKALTRKP